MIGSADAISGNAMICSITMSAKSRRLFDMIRTLSFLDYALSQRLHEVPIVAQ
jgi:hypothetical protein